ncbi:MAG: sodium:proton antiporter NhaD [Oceanococcus sp.]
MASETAHAVTSSGLDLSNSLVGYLALTIFVLAYVLVMLEDVVHLRKSKPVVLAAGVIWAMIAVAYRDTNPEAVAQALRHNLLEFSELFLFLLVAMTYINAMQERNVFDRLRSTLSGLGLSYRQMFWLTGVLSFFLSAIADNLTTALVMVTIVLAVAAGNRKFIAPTCVNIVVAANAGGAFSPFGDITTLMVWQAGKVEFLEFFDLFLPSVVNALVPALIMHWFIPKGHLEPNNIPAQMKKGAKRICLLFLLTIATAVGFHSVLHLPPAVGMMTGLSYLKMFGYYLRRRELHQLKDDATDIGDVIPFDVFRRVAQAEWDTLLFFYGIILAVGGLGFIGYLEMTSAYFYGELGPTTANIMVGIFSAIVDNIPVMFAVLSMDPDMSHGQWLLVTLTAGVGGSLLAIGSAAGVALLGQARGYYSFFSHLRWVPAIALGLAASVACHFWINESTFQIFNH